MRKQRERCLPGGVFFYFAMSRLYLRRGIKQYIRWPQPIGSKNKRLSVMKRRGLPHQGLPDSSEINWWTSREHITHQQLLYLNKIIESTSNSLLTELWTLLQFHTFAESEFFKQRLLFAGWTSIYCWKIYHIFNCCAQNPNSISLRLLRWLKLPTLSISSVNLLKVHVMSHYLAKNQIPSK